MDAMQETELGEAILTVLEKNGFLRSCKGGCDRLTQFLDDPKRRMASCPCYSCKDWRPIGRNLTVGVDSSVDPTVRDLGALVIRELAVKGYRVEK